MRSCQPPVEWRLGSSFISLTIVYALASWSHSAVAHHSFAGLFTDEGEEVIEIYDGSIDGIIPPSMGGYLALKNAALVRVVDWGVPVEGATVTVQRKQVTPNAEGVAVHTATYRNVTEILDDSTGVLAVYILKDGHSQVKRWDPSIPSSFDFMMSTIDGGSTFGWLRLEKTFSPYYLEGDLIVTAGTTMTLLEFVSLTVKSEAGIRVDGGVESTKATITGADWDGISTSGGGVMW